MCRRNVSKSSYPAETATNSVATQSDIAGATGRIDYKSVQAVLEQRCYSCHGPQVQMKNVRLDTAQSLKLHAQAVFQQVVVTKAMPMNNATGITDTERALIKQWFESGAAVN